MTPMNSSLSSFCSAYLIAFCPFLGCAYGLGQFPSSAGHISLWGSPTGSPWPPSSSDGWRPFPDVECAPLGQTFCLQLSVTDSTDSWLEQKIMRHQVSQCCLFGLNLFYCTTSSVEGWWKYKPTRCQGYTPVDQPTLEDLLTWNC